MSRQRRKLMPRSALLVLLAAVATALSADVAGARELCAQSQQLDSLVSVRFERVVEIETGKEEAVLRLVNQTNCGVVVRVWTRPVVVSAGRVRFVEDGEEPPDGARVEINYAVHKPQLTGTVEPPAWGGGCVVDLVTIPAGRSVLFRVPASEFRLRYNIAVPFYFIGESRPQHQAFFYWSASPES
jgi:hypothetical protein